MRLPGGQQLHCMQTQRRGGVLVAVTAAAVWIAQALHTTPLMSSLADSRPCKSSDLVRVEATGYSPKYQGAMCLLPALAAGRCEHEQVHILDVRDETSVLKHEEIMRHCYIRDVRTM